MKRSPIRRKKPLRARRWEGADVEREPKPYARPTVASLHRGSYAGTTTAAPKTTAYRDQALRDMAENRPCLLLVPCICSHRTDTTVACHSNLSIHGKSLSRKADDVFSVWGCGACHAWLDHGSAPAEQKEAVFMAGHLLQVLAWREVAQSREPERFRKAARRALEQLQKGKA